MKVFKIVFFLLVGVFIFAIVKMFSKNTQSQGDTGFIPTYGGGGGNTAGGILTAVVNGFLGLFNAGVFKGSSSSDTAGDSRPPLGGTSGDTQWA